MTTFKTTETRTLLDAECESCRALFATPVGDYGNRLRDYWILSHNCQVIL